MGAGVRSRMAPGARRSVLVAALLALGVVGVAARRLVVVRPDSCAGEQHAIVIDTDRHVLTVCEDGAPKAVHGVRLGRNGVGKAREGDRKTPLGRYPLGAPTASRDFGTFVPIGYPTPDQRRAGLTGGAVGIHGPSRLGKHFGPFVNLVDTTDGCVGVASDDEARELAAWVRAHEHATVVLR